MDELPDDDHIMDAVGFDPMDDSMRRAQDEMFSNSNEDMDIDGERRSDDDGTQEKEKKEPPILVERPLVDIDYVLQNFKSTALIIRLLYIADVCPPLRVDALKAAINYLINHTQDITSYSTVYQKIDGYRATNGLDANAHLPPFNTDWQEKTLLKANTRLDILLAEFRRQKDDGVKESIRRAMDEVFQQHMTMGNIQEALKLYSRGIREYCTTPIYLIQMLLNWITAAVYAEQWPKLSILLPQAERAVNEATERDPPAAANGNAAVRPAGQPTGAPNSAQKNSRSFRETVSAAGAKVTAICGLGHMKSGNFKAAALKLISIELDSFAFPELLSAQDIAYYASLCALATFSRSELKEKVIASPPFRKFLESEPKLVDLLHRFVRNQFGACLDILAELKDMLLLNVYLSPHVTTLYNQIRRRAIIQYFEPYLSANMNEMAVEFRTTAEKLQEELTDLIRQKVLNARIDGHTHTLLHENVDRQVEVHQNSISSTNRLNYTIRAILLRAALQQKNCVVGMQEMNARRRRQMEHEESGRDGSPNGPAGLLAQVHKFVGGGSREGT